MPRTLSNRTAPLGHGLRLPALSLLFASALTVALLMLPPGAKAATTWHVSPNSAGACTPADPNCATIQAAVNAASAGDTIQVAAGTYAEHVSINKDLTVNGAGAGQTIVDGTQSGTVFIINTSTAVNLSGITVTNGKAQSNSPSPCGPPSCGGGIFNSGTLNLASSTVSGNSASSGGGIWNEGAMTLTGCTVSNNSAPGIGVGGGIFNDTGRTLTITDSTVSNNLAGHGGGIDTNVNSTVTVISSTVSGNASTISAGGGISNSGGDGALQLRSSIVAGNTSPDSPDLSGGATSQGHNLVGISDGSHGLTNGTNGDIVGTASAPVDAKLAPLGNYGGPTQTQLLLCGSPAIDAGDDAVTGAPLSLTTDQRGVARKSGAHVDIGAVERQQGSQVNSQDSGPGSLRQLIADAADGAVIDLDCASAATVTLTSDEILINKSLTINGPGPSLLTVQRSSAQGTPNFRVFEVSAGKTVNLSAMTVSNGEAAAGGGLLNNNGTVNVTNVVVSNNSGVQGCGVFSQGTLTVTNSTFSGNATFPNGGEGGGLFNGGTLTVTNSTFTNGSATKGGGLFNNGGTASVTASTFSNNTVVQGGGIYNTGPLTLTNSTVSGNVASGIGNAAGGIFNDFGPLTLTSSTVSNNTAGSGGGIVNNGGVGGTVNVRSSIVAGNTASSANSGPDVAGQFASQGHNLVGISDDSTGFVNGTNGDIVGTASAPVDAMLRPLGNYGGPTQTQLPRPTSPAIDAGDDAVLNPPFNLVTDQRGVARKTGSHVDIGAVELNPNTDIPGGVFQFGRDISTVFEGSGHINITVSRTGQLTQAATVDFATADNDPNHLLPCSQVTGNASSRCDYEATSGTLQFAPGDSSKTFTVLINDDSFVEGDETAKLILSNPTGDSALGPQSTATLKILDNDITSPTTNPIDGAQFFVTQHYHDFLNREPDVSGLNFWTNGITSCGSDANCTEVKRVNTSAAFFLSIEFQNTGYFVVRFYKAAFGDINPPSVPVPVRFDNFIRGTQTVGQGVVVGQGNWQQQLAANKSAFALAFVQRADFLARYPDSTSASAFVNALDANAGGVLTNDEKAALVSELAPNPSDFSLRADVLQKVAENAVLQQREFNRAFVLMEYFGYLRRNPDDSPDSNFSGYNFWLGKLNQFGGDFVKAEMVRAFIESAEYRQRFGP
jgi:Calx-beta domain